MKMKIAFVLALIAFAGITRAQTKVFKEVSDEISSQMKVITQDEVLIGYLVFTQLEKASKDSFNYQISIMDENLNDIGKVTFKEQNLELHSVSFEQDILCLGYVKTELSDMKNTSVKEIKKSVIGGKNAVFTQLINLEGEIVKSNAIPVTLVVKDEISTTRYYRPSAVAGKLKHRIILKNIPGQGFACFYGDESKNTLLAFDVTGKQIWKKEIPAADDFGMLTSGPGVYLLSRKKIKMREGGYELRGFSTTDGAAYDRYVLKDKKGNELRVIDFENDPQTGKPFITGNIINSRQGNQYSTGAALSSGTYDGVFTIAVNGPKKTDIKETFTYWNDGSKMPMISKKGMFSQTGTYTRFSQTLRDFNGNTYFIGNSFVKKPRVGAIVGSVVLSPFIFPPVMLLIPGINKTKVTEGILLKQDPSGRLTIENTIAGDKSRFYPARTSLSLFNTKSFHTVTNVHTKSNFVIMDDDKNIVIYNVGAKKVVRKVPHRDGKISTAIFPAKEGHIMVVETNRAEKYTRLSIEAL